MDMHKAFEKLAEQVQTNTAFISSTLDLINEQREDIDRLELLVKSQQSEVRSLRRKNRSGRTAL